MSAKTCQLCGKPINRIWSGGNGDFCSREHRNQYGLRRGMDRLQEADHVATLMRRRENPKAISAARLISVVGVSPRGFLEEKLPADPRAPRLVSAALAVSFAPPSSIPAKSYIEPRPMHPAGDSVDRQSASPLRYPVRLAAPFLPPRDVRLPVCLGSAQLAQPSCRVLAAATHHRPFDMLRSTEAREFLGAGSLAMGRVDRPDLEAVLAKAKHTRAIATCARNTSARRATARVGLPPPALRMAARDGFQFPAREPAWQARPSLPFRGARGPRAPRTIHLDISTLRLCELSSPAPICGAGIPWPDAMALRSRPPYPGATPSQRACGALWDTSRFADPLAVWRAAAAQGGFTAWEGLRLFAPPQAPAGGPAARSAPDRLLPPNGPMPERPPMTTIQGTVAGTLGGAAPDISNGVAPCFEERFDSGWKNWVGETKDWRLNAAGVRTGSLALFVPSLDLRDYEFEFLTHVETRSVTWVFRAANFSDYYRASIAAAPGGGYQFTRGVVTGGVAAPALVKPARIVTKGKPLFTVRMRVAGSKFAVSVDGEPIDSWADNRLAVGGIGFMSATNDRARLYWVRLFPSANVRKEYQKR